MATSPEMQRTIDLLLRLSVSPENSEPALQCISQMDSKQREELLRLAKLHHVNVRALQALSRAATKAGVIEIVQWADALLVAEQSRRLHALGILQRICDELEQANCPITVIKSLDHLPDLGTDFDLYTPGKEEPVIRLLTQKFKAVMEPRSWGDRLSHKWNFAIPGLAEVIEVHVGRLGQTGEHITLAQRFTSRRVKLKVNEFVFYVPAPEERIIAATLQRMYRHYFFRICDITNVAELLKAGCLDITELTHAAEAAGIWSGVATYLTVVSDMFTRYRGEGIFAFQDWVTRHTWFRAEKLYVSNHGFLRFPILPDAAGLYIRQLTRTAAAGNIAAAFRLSLLPPLASMAGLATKLVGSDKGIW